MKLNARFGGGGTFTQETPSGTIDGTNAAFSLSSVPASGQSLLVMQNGLLVSASEYTLSAASITFQVPPPVGSILVVYYVK